MDQTILSLTDLCVYQEQNLVLNQVNLSLQKGEFCYLIGETGSGKSSLLKILYGDLQIKQGQAQIVNYNLNELKESDIPYLRRKIGIIFQDFKLLPDRTVKDNLLFVLKATGWTNASEMDERCEQVLDKVGMKTKGFKFPHELSGGEQQRVAIARALLNNPELILADEPTGNLDPKTSVEVMKVLEEIHKGGNTILMATHDYALILKYPHKTIKCHEGAVFQVNTHQV